MTGEERDRAEHNAALLRFGGKFPKGKKCSWKYGGKHISIRFAPGDNTGRMDYGFSLSFHMFLTWGEGQGECLTNDGKVRRRI